MAGTHIKGPLTVGGVEVISAAGAVTADIQATAGSISRTELSSAAAQKSAQITGATIATTSTSIEYVSAPTTGTLSAITVTPLVALTANDTNYITWTVVNLGQANAGSTAMLATSDLNTTKATGGTSLAINTPLSLVVHATPANVAVTEGDLLKIVATATGTLANTVTRPIYKLSFAGTT